jgi:hypothetical protein
MTGYAGDDLISGDFGADILKSSSGNDRIVHGSALTSADGSKDTMDCGAGNDEAWINTADGDTTVSDCEIVHTDLENPFP